MCRRVQRLNAAKTLVSENSNITKIHNLAPEGTLNSSIIQDLTLSRAAPLAVSKVRGGGAHCAPPPLVSWRVGGLWAQILVATSYLTMIDTKQKDLPL